VVVFCLLTVVIFQFAMPASPPARQAMAAGALWVALLFGSTLGFSRLVAAETETGGLEAILVSPIDRGALFVGKWLSGMAFSSAVAAVLLPAFVALLGLRVDGGQMLALAAVIVVGLVGWVAAGVLLAFMAQTTRARDVLLPVLLFPLVMPLVVAGVHATGAVIDGSNDQLGSALALIVAFDVVFWVLGFLAMGPVAEG
jgi:heme exporter protein B